MGHIHVEAINGSEDGIIFLPPGKESATGFSGLELIPGLLTVSFVLVIPAVVALILSLCHKRPHAFSPPPLIPPPTTDLLSPCLAENIPPASFEPLQPGVIIVS